ncbi:MAG: Rne/Rng family ribonuclease [Gammaproteobacteria bacterium]
MKRMLINATQHEELRVAIVDGQKLINLDIESIGKEQKKSNIYKGVVTRIEPSLEAAFVDYGAKRHGFLSVKDVAPDLYAASEEHHGRMHIRDVLNEGQEILVQVEKEERGSKGAALTTFISLAGCYLVLVPNNPRAAGISKRVEGEERDDLRSILDSLPLPEGMGLIARTASAGRNHAELAWDLQALLERWKTIQQVSKEKRAPLLIHQESGVIIRSIRDHLREDIHEILIDDPEVFTKTRDYVRSLRPDYVNRVKLYRDTVPLFNRYQIESTIESAFQREVKLPSGGSVVIDRTEALVSIDINSAKATKGSDIEETAVNTNLEAADEISRQLRLRDLAGLIVIDFIDMSMSNHQREVENRLREALHDDRARVQVGRISRFGLLEMSRQRLGPTLAEAIEDICPICHGHGTVRGVASLSLVILRALEEEAIKENTAQVQAQLPVEVATYLLNEKRKQLSQIEQRHHVEVVIIPNQYLQRPHYDVSRVRQDEIATQTNVSYKLIRLPQELTNEEAPQERRAEPVLKDLRGIGTTTQRQPGLFKRIFSSIFGEGKQTESKSAANEVAIESPSQSSSVDRRSARNDRSRQQRQPRSRGSTPGRARKSDNLQDSKMEPQELSEDARLQSKYADESTSDKQRGNRPERGGRTERGPRQRRTTTPESSSYTLSNKIVSDATAETVDTEQTPTVTESPYTLTNRIVPETIPQNANESQTIPTVSPYTLTNRIVPETTFENVNESQTSKPESAYTLTNRIVPETTSESANLAQTSTPESSLTNRIVPETSLEHTHVTSTAASGSAAEQRFRTEEPAITTTHVPKEVANRVEEQTFIKEELAITALSHVPEETVAKATQVETTVYPQTTEPTERNEAEESVTEEALTEEGTETSTRYPRRRKPQRPYRGPGRRRTRGGEHQQRRSPQETEPDA